MSDDQINILREDIKELTQEVNNLRVEMTKNAVAASTVAQLEEQVRMLEGVEQRRLGGFGVLGVITGAIGALFMALFAWWLSTKS